MERIYKWIIKLTSGEEQVEQNDNLSPQEDNLGDNNIDRSDAIVKSIISTLKKSYKGDNIAFNNRVLSLHITDSITFDSLVNRDDFIDRISEGVYTELGAQFANIAVTQSSLDEVQSYRKIDDSTFINIKQQSVQTNSSKARIVILDGFGSTIEPEYILSCEGENPNTRWNMGVGRYPKMANGSFRENQIAIDDNDQAQQFENNRFVSRSHAHITYHKKAGFLLHVEMGGSRQSDKRTRIFRRGEIIEVDNINIPERLCDGDLIELSKHVRLLFQLLK